MIEFKIFVNEKEILYDEKKIFTYGSRKFYPANFVSPFSFSSFSSISRYIIRICSSTFES